MWAAGGGAGEVRARPGAPSDTWALGRGMGRAGCVGVLGEEYQGEVRRVKV